MIRKKQRFCTAARTPEAFLKNNKVVRGEGAPDQGAPLFVQGRIVRVNGTPELQKPDLYSLKEKL